PPVHPARRAVRWPDVVADARRVAAVLPPPGAQEGLAPHRPVAVLQVLEQMTQRFHLAAPPVAHRDRDDGLRHRASPPGPAGAAPPARRRRWPPRPAA